MTDFPDLKIKALVSFPAAVYGGAGIAVRKENGQFFFDLDFSEFAPPVAGLTDPAHQNALLWNDVTQSYALVPASALIGGGVSPATAVPLIESGLGAVGTSIKYAREDHVHPAYGGGGIPDAPNDGVQYGRQSLGWTPVTGGGGGPSPSNANPLMDGVAAPGVSLLYTRGDHVHPTDTSRAPLASPTFTGTPAAPTPTAGDNSTRLATTAFVLANGPAPSNANPAMNGAVAPGVSLLYARGDHVHPVDTSRAPLASPALTGVPTAPTATLGDNSTTIATTAFVLANSGAGAGAVRYDIAQSLTAAQQAQARQNVYAAPFDALAFNGMQINGGFAVSQENAANVIAFASGSVTKYAVDGTMIAKTGTSAFNLQQVNSVFPGYPKELQLTITTAQAAIGSDYIYFEHLIEGYRFARAMWGSASAVPVSVGFWVKSSVAGAVSLQLVNAGITASVMASVTITAANTAQWVTATFAAQTTGTWDNTNGTGARLRIFAATTGGVNIAATNGNSFEITGLVVLPGSELPVAARAPFLMRPFDDEWLLCQRYLWFWNQPTAFTRLGLGFADTATTAQFVTPLPTTMRASPTLTFLNLALSGIINITSINFLSLVSNQLTWTGNSSGLTVGPIQLFTNASAGFLKADARLA